MDNEPPLIDSCLLALKSTSIKLMDIKSYIGVLNFFKQIPQIQNPNCNLWCDHIKYLETNIDIVR